MAIEWHGRDVTKWVIIGGLALFWFAVLAFFVGSDVYWSLTGPGVGDVNALIDRNLSNGASTDEVAAFLDANHIEHTVFGQGGDCPYGEEPGISPSHDTQTICGIIRDAERGWLGNSDLVLYFVFDQRQRLTNHIVLDFCLCGF